MTRKIFNIDEMELRSVDPNWTQDTLLNQEGIFYLKDLLAPLGINRLIFKRREETVKAAGQDTWEVMGVRKVWSHYQVRMKVFAPFYREHLMQPFLQVPENWNANHVANQTEGVYLLKDITKLIPFTAPQLRYKAKRAKDSRAEIGIWKDEKLNLFLVDLAKFGPWLKQTWKKGTLIDEED